MKVPGIYQIQSKIKPNRIYIGSAVNITNRWRVHICQLRKNKHHSIKLQRHYNKYGIEDLEFSILLLCNKKELIINEQNYLNKIKCYFNISKVAGNTLGIKYRIGSCIKLIGNKNGCGNKGIPKSELHKNNLRKAHLGKKLTKEHKEKMSKSAKLRWQKIKKNSVHE